MTNEAAKPVIVDHFCPEHGQVMQAPASFTVTCGRCGRACTPDTEAA